MMSRDLCRYCVDVLVILILVSKGSARVTRKSNLTLHTAKATWAAATGVCEKEGGRLVTIDSQTVADAIEDFRMDNWPGINFFWTGLFDSNPPTMAYVWSGVNAPLGSYRPWNPGSWKVKEPNNLDFEHCVRADTHWYSTQCDIELPFICQTDQGNCFYSMEENHMLPINAIASNPKTAEACKQDCESEACWAVEFERSSCYNFGIQSQVPDAYLVYKPEAFVYRRICYQAALHTEGTSITQYPSTTTVPTTTGGLKVDDGPVISKTIQAAPHTEGITQYPAKTTLPTSMGGVNVDGGVIVSTTTYTEAAGSDSGQSQSTGGPQSNIPHMTSLKHVVSNQLETLSTAASTATAGPSPDRHGPGKRLTPSLHIDDTEQPILISPSSVLSWTPYNYDTPTVSNAKSSTVEPFSSGASQSYRTDGSSVTEKLSSAHQKNSTALSASHLAASSIGTIEFTATPNIISTELKPSLLPFSTFTTMEESVSRLSSVVSPSGLNSSTQKFHDDSTKTQPSETGAFAMNPTALCRCACPKKSMSHSESEVFMASVLQDLILPRNSTSAYRRKRTSATDNRETSTGIGASGAVLLAAVFGGLILLDLSKFKSDLCSTFDTIRQ